MAHSPQKRAKAVSDYLGGMGWDATCAKHKISKGILSKWVEDYKTEQKLNSSEIAASPQQARADKFNSALERFLGATVEMLNVWAEECADREFIRKDPQGVHELGKTVLERADRFVSLVRPTEDKES